MKKPIKLTIKPGLFYKFNRQSDTLQKSHRQSSKDLLRRFKLSASKRSQERCETIDFYNGNGKSYSPTSNNHYSSNINKPPKLKLRLSQDYKKNRWSTKSRQNLAVDKQTEAAGIHRRATNYDASASYVQ